MRDLAGFREFAVSRTPALHRSALLLCGDAHLAEDLVQETLAKVYAAWGRAIDNPAAYAQTVLVRTFVSSRRRRWTGEQPVEELPETASADADVAGRVDLMRALAVLPPADRAVLVLRFLEDRSVEQVAAALRLSPGTVRVRTHRALVKVRDQLGSSLDSEALS